MVYVNHVLLGFISVSLSKITSIYGLNNVQINKHTLLNQHEKTILFIFICITKFTAYTIKSKFSLCFFSSDILLYLFFPYSLFLFFSSSDKFLYLSLACPLNLSVSFPY